MPSFDLEQSRLRHQLKAFQEGRADPYGEDPAANYDLDDNALDFEEEHEDLEDEEEPLEIDEDLENDELHAELATVERTLQAKEARMRHVVRGSKAAGRSRRRHYGTR